tara:strand:- start:45 stop:395 length:351 start_codon:yes stop_codon:yes gene_type:complete
MTKGLGYPVITKNPFSRSDRKTQIKNMENSIIIERADEHAQMAWGIVAFEVVNIHKIYKNTKDLEERQGQLQTVWIAFNEYLRSEFAITFDKDRKYAQDFLNLKSTLSMIEDLKVS